MPRIHQKTSSFVMLSRGIEGDHCKAAEVAAETLQCSRRNLDPVSLAATILPDTVLHQVDSYRNLIY